MALGELGFVLGDGALDYGPEKIMECYYNFPILVHAGFFGAVDVQYIDNPAITAPADQSWSRVCASTSNSEAGSR